MKVDFEEIIFNDKFDVTNKAFYISGNEETLIKKIEKTLVGRFSKNEKRSVERIKSIEETTADQNLFFEKSLIILSEIKGLTKDNIEKLTKEKDLIIVCENTRGDQAVKKLFEKSKKLALINCYKLNTDQKIKLLNFFINKKNINIEKDAFWYLIENTEDRYIFYENELVKLLESSIKDFKLENIKKLISSKINEDFYRLFFCVQKTNLEIINLYNLTINNISDLYKFLYVVKFCLEIIINSENLPDLENKIPKYMFKDKKNFISMFNKIKPNNKKKLFELIFKTEKLVRKNNNQYYEIGNRFLLNLKKHI